MDAPASLMELLEGIRDPRSAKGERHLLSAVLGFAIVAMLAGMTTYGAIAQCGKERGREHLSTAFTKGNTA